MQTDQTGNAVKISPIPRVFPDKPYNFVPLCPFSPPHSPKVQASPVPAHSYAEAGLYWTLVPHVLGKDDHNHCSSLHLAVLRIVSLPEVLCQDILLHIVGKALLQAIKPIHYTPPSFPVLFFISNRKINHCSSSTGAVLPHRRQSSGWYYGGSDAPNSSGNRRHPHYAPQNRSLRSS